MPPTSTRKRRNGAGWCISSASRSNEGLSRRRRPAILFAFTVRVRIREGACHETVHRPRSDDRRRARRVRLRRARLHLPGRARRARRLGAGRSGFALWAAAAVVGFVWLNRHPVLFFVVAFLLFFC